MRSFTASGCSRWRKWPVPARSQLDVVAGLRRRRSRRPRCRCSRRRRRAGTGSAGSGSGSSLPARRRGQHRAPPHRARRGSSRERRRGWPAPRRASLARATPRRRVEAGRPVLPQHVDEREVVGRDDEVGERVLEEEHVPRALELRPVGDERRAHRASRAARPARRPRRQRSGAWTAAPHVAGAPQSWPMITASSSPPSASWNPIASRARTPVW